MACKYGTFFSIEMLVLERVTVPCMQKRSSVYALCTRRYVTII